MCKAIIIFGDDFGDNQATFHCQLEEGHIGLHQESGDMGNDEYKLPYTLTWQGDDNDREKIYQKKILELQERCEHKDIRQRECWDCGKEF